MGLFSELEWSVAVHSGNNDLIRQAQLNINARLYSKDLCINTNVYKNKSSNLQERFTKFHINGSKKFDSNPKANYFTNDIISVHSILLQKPKLSTELAKTSICGSSFQPQFKSQ